MKPKLWLARAALVLMGLINLSSGPARPAAGLVVETTAWRDEFKTQTPHWDWVYEAGTGYKHLTSLPEAPSAVEIGITADSASDSYSDCSLHEQNEMYTNGALEMRLRTSDDNGPMGSGKGTRGWGFWDGDIRGKNAAWFWSASPDSGPELSGLRIQVLRNGVLLLNEPIQVDMQQWHTYRVELSNDRTRFFVDGNQVGEVAGVPAVPQRAELWIDNLSLQPGGARFLDLLQDQKMFIDWASYTPLSTPSPVTRYRVALPIVISR